MTEDPGFGGVPASRRSVVLAAPFVLGALAFGRGRALAQAAAAIAPDIGTAAGPLDAAPAFPLAVKPGRRYLVDAAGKPFMRARMGIPSVPTRSWSISSSMNSPPTHRPTPMVSRHS